MQTNICRTTKATLSPPRPTAIAWGSHKNISHFFIKEFYMDKETLDLVQAKNYTDKEGNEKTQWIKIGKLFTKMGVPSSMKLDCYPIPDDKGEVWLKIFPKDYKAVDQANGFDSSDATLETDIAF